MSHVIKKVRCPKCEERGQDRHRDNLAVYSDGHEYCFACGYRTGSDLRNQIKEFLSKPSANIVLNTPLRSSNSNTSNSHVLPQTPPESHVYASSPRNFPSRWLPAVISWLSSYGITPAEVYAHRIYYDLDTDCLVFPVYNGDVLALTNSRYFGPNPNYPKYITKGRKNVYKVFTPPVPSQIFVLTEDYLSALKVGRQFNAIPLLGAHFSENLSLALLSKTTSVRIWLDLDKANEAIKLTKKASQWIKDCGTIITEKDPKEYSDKEILEIVTATLPASPKKPLKL